MKDKITNVLYNKLSRTYEIDVLEGQAINGQQADAIYEDAQALADEVISAIGAHFIESLR